MDNHLSSTCDGFFHINSGTLELCCKIYGSGLGGGETRKTLMRLGMEREITATFTLWKLVELIRHHSSSYTMSLNVTRCHSLCWGGTAARPTAFTASFSGFSESWTRWVSGHMLRVPTSPEGHSHQWGWGQQETYVGVCLSSWVPVCPCSDNFTSSSPSQLLAWLSQVQPGAKSSPQVPSVCGDHSPLLSMTLKSSGCLTNLWLMYTPDFQLWVLS